MSVLVFIDTAEKQIKKSSLEAASYAAQAASAMGTHADAVVLGACRDNLSDLGQYGIRQVYLADDRALDHFDAQAFTRAMARIADIAGAKLIVFSHNTNGKALAPRLSVRLSAGLVSGVIALPHKHEPFTVRKSVFSGKAFADLQILTDRKLVSVNPNAFGIHKTGGTATVVPVEGPFDSGRIQVESVSKVTGDVPLTEADIVVSGGRGLKGPENWGLVTDLASALGAATACSRPVADVHWRPHHEHVGQTGLTVAPNLYIAIGISGAIQHLAGVNRSKTIVVINKDPEAPFFKAADYGIVGDAFEIVPRLTAAIKQLKSNG